MISFTSFRKSLYFVARSFCFQLLFCMVVFTVVLEWARPVRLFTARGVILGDQDAIDKKFAQCIKNNPKVIILGSSLVQCASYFADHPTQYSDSANPQEVEEYTSSKYFDETCKSDLVKSSTFNFSLSGLLVSDYLTILQSTLQAGATPEEVYLFTAPRDFIDRLKVNGEGSHIHRYFSKRTIAQSYTPTDLALNLFDELYLARHRIDLFTILNLYACQLLHRSPDLFNGLDNRPKEKLIWLTNAPSAVKNVAPVDRFAATSADLDVYKKRYLPIDNDKYIAEMESFRKLVEVCNAKSIKLTVVVMPISRANLNLLPKPFLELFQNELNRAIAANHSAKLLVLLTDNSLGPAEYSDSVHLNAHGARHFWKLLSTKLGAENSRARVTKTTFH